MSESDRTPADAVGRTLRSDDECAAAIELVGMLDRKLAAIEASKDAAVAEAEKKAEEQATPILNDRTTIAAKIQAYCARERVRLTKNHATKTVAFATGEVSWRKSRGKVVVDPDAKEKVLQRLKAIGNRFIRVTESIDYSEVGAMFRLKTDAPAAERKLAARLKRIAGLDYQPGRESFEVKPAGAQLNERPPKAA